MRKPSPARSTAAAASATPSAEPVATSTPVQPAAPVARKFYDEEEYAKERMRSMRLVMHAHSMSEEDMDALEQRISLDPSDLDSRLKLACSNPINRRPSWRSNALWLIREYPDHPLVGQRVGMLFFNMDEEVLDIWAKHLAAHPADVVLLENAAEFFRLSDKKRSLELYQRLRQLQPNRYDWAMRLAEAHRFAAAMPGGQDKEEGQAALADYRAALSVAGSERHRVLPWAADAALAVGEAAEAEGYARELLADHRASSEEHRAHILLGRVALSKKKIKAASDELLLAGKVAADPVLQSFGPDMTLASDLWDAGARAAVSEYLNECRSLWTSQLPRLDGFIVAAARGQKPEFKALPSPPSMPSSTPR